MKIGYLTHAYDPEVSSNAIPGIIARALHQRGNQIKVLTGYPNYPEGKIYDGYRIRPYQREIRDDMVVGRMPLWPSHDTSALKRLITYGSWALSASVGCRVLRGSDAALVHHTPGTNAIPAIVLRACYRVPYVLHVQDLWPDTVTATEFLSPTLSKLAERLLHPMLDLMYRKASAIACTSPGMVDAIANRGIDRSKLSVVSNWVDEKIFAPAERDTALAQELQLREFTICYGGNMAPLQNLDVLLAAARQLKNDDRIGFLLVGGGHMREQYIQASQDLPNVRFVGPQPMQEMSRFLALGDVNYIGLQDKPLFRMTLPSKLQATLCSGRPIVAAVAGDASRVITEAKAGLVSHPDDVSGLVTSIRYYADHRDQAVTAGTNGRKYYLAEFSQEVSSARLEQLLHEAMLGR